MALRTKGLRTKRQLEVGEIVPPHFLKTIHGRGTSIPDDSRPTHLQFRRYAGCPICTLHLHTFVQRNHEIEGAGVQEVVVFHSSTETMLEQKGDLPFAALADPTRKLYAEFGVGTSLRVWYDPRSLAAGARAIAWVVKHGKTKGMFGIGDEHESVPADFFIAPSGRILAVKYGVHANDHWSVDQVLHLAKAAKDA
jgi:peroxiredoxin